MAPPAPSYGIMTAHFYWLGAIPAMIFMGLFMMPFYYGSKARSVPEYLKMRFDEKTRGLTACYVRGDDHLLFGHLDVRPRPAAAPGVGWNFNVSVLASAAFVLAYTYLGGLTSAIYNECAAVLPDRGGIRAAGHSGMRQGGGCTGSCRACPPT